MFFVIKILGARLVYVGCTTSYIVNNYFITNCFLRLFPTGIYTCLQLRQLKGDLIARCYDTTYRFYDRIYLAPVLGCYV